MNLLLWFHQKLIINTGMKIQELNPDPLVEFEKWFQLAKQTTLEQPEAMALATVGKDLRPHVRVVLFKGFHDGCLSFFTNYESQKSQELLANPEASICFYWEPLHRQIRIEGEVSRASVEVSDHYWDSRPRGSQLSAMASPQSQSINNTEELQARVLRLDAEFANKKIPRPQNWGGFLLKPKIFEFWVGREHRLHERFVYRLSKSTWMREQLAP